MERMTRSAERLAFPVSDECHFCLYPYLRSLMVLYQKFTGEHLNTLIKKLVEVDSAWIPTEVNTSLCESCYFDVCTVAVD